MARPQRSAVSARSAEQPSARILVGLTLLSAAAVAVQLWGLYRVTGPPSPPWFPSADKLQHLLGFAIPVLLIMVTVDAYARRRRHRTRRAALVVVAGLFAAHAVVSEIIQHVGYPTRSGDPLDAVADLAGVAAGTVAYAMIVRRASVTTTAAHE